MGSFEWMELQTLTSDINASRSRLTAARANKDSRLIRILEAEITEAEARRDRLLTSITTNLTDPGEAAQSPPETQAPDAAVPASVNEEPVATDGGAAAAAVEATAEGPAEQVAGEPDERPAEEDREAPVVAAGGDSVEGGMIVWDQLTPGDIQRALAAIGDRRAEMLARHAEELKSLEVEQTELEGLEKAIDAFVRRLNKAEPAASEATASAA
jgi:hypothetical protein